MNEIYEEFLNIGCSKYQAKRRAKIVYKNRGEFSDGIIYTELRDIGIDKKVAFKAEALFWIIYDERIPPSPYEKAFTKFIEGVSKQKYHQVNILDF